MSIRKNSIMLASYICLCLASCSLSSHTNHSKNQFSKVLNHSQTTRTDGLIYSKENNTLFTGTIVEIFENGNLKTLATVKNGEADGHATFWYKNGQRKLEFNVREGVREGMAYEWHRNGSLKAKAKYKDNNRHGLATTYYENGVKKSVIRFINDIRQEKSIKEWGIDGSQVIPIIKL